jgi:flagellin
MINGEAENGTLDFHVGAYAGEQNRIQFDTNKTDATASTIGITGLNVANKGDALDSLKEIDGAINKVSSYRAELGSLQSRLGSTVANLESQAINQDNARSIIQDVDVAHASAKLASANVLQAAGVATLSQANAIPNSALRLIS